MRRRALAAALCLAAVVTLAACDDGGSTPAARTRASSTTAAAPTSTTSFTATVTATIPAEFPTEVPLPQDVGLESATTTGPGARAFDLAYALGSTSPGDAMDAYESRLDTAGFTVTKLPGTAASEDTPSALQADGHGWRVVVRPGDATVTVAVAPR